MRSCGAYDPALTVAEDHDLWLRLVGLGPVVLLPTTVLEYRIHTGQQPRDEEEAGDRVRRSWAAKLPPAERGEVLRILEARTLIRSGVLAIRRGEYAAALRDYVRGARHAPELVRSSLSRSAVLHGVLKAVLGVIGGHHLVSAATRLTSAVRLPLSRSRS